jgi:hypothetical protein
MRFGEVLGTGWRLTMRTLSSAGVLVIVTCLAIAVASVPILRGMLQAVAGVVSDSEFYSENPDPQVLANHMEPHAGEFTSFFMLATLSSLILLFLWVAATHASWGAMSEERPRFGEMISATFRRSYWYALAQSIILVMISVMLSGAITLLGAALVTSAGDTGSIILELIFRVALIYLTVLLIFRVHQIVIADRGPWHGMIASIALVKNNWWRTFGVLLVVGLLFAILSIPFIVMMFVPATSAVETMGHAMNGDRPDPIVVKMIFTTLADTLSPLYIGALGLVAGISLLLFVNTVTALYVDLRARRGDFLDDEDETATGAGAFPTP